MKICTCQKCNHIYEDIVPSDSSKDYPDIDLPQLLMKPSKEGLDYDYLCPECKTDAYLIPNIVE